MIKKNRDNLIFYEKKRAELETEIHTMTSFSTKKKIENQSM